MTEPDDVSQGYVANVTANFLVFDGIPDRYLVVQHVYMSRIKSSMFHNFPFKILSNISSYSDADQIDQRFPKTKMEWDSLNIFPMTLFVTLRMASWSMIFAYSQWRFLLSKALVVSSLLFVNEPESGLYT